MANANFYVIPTFGEKVKLQEFPLTADKNRHKNHYLANLFV